MKEPIAQQRLKLVYVQFGGALFCTVFYLIYDSTTLLPLFYSIGIGLCYSSLLYFGIRISNRLSQVSPQRVMVALVGFAVLRFVVVGVLMALGFRYFPDTPMAVLLPFSVVLLAPILLFPFKKGLTD